MTHQETLISISATNSETFVSGHFLAFARVSLLCLMLGLISTAVRAAPLNLVKTFPDFTLAIDQVYDYTASTKTLTISGTIGSYTEIASGGVLANSAVRNSVTALGDPADLPEAFSLTATFNASGEVISGAFTLDGVVAEPVTTSIYNGFLDSSGHLLSGDLSVSGFTGDGSGTTNGAIFEFLFDNADGFISKAGNRIEDPFTGAYTGGGMILTLTNGVVLGAGGNAPNDFFDSTAWVAQDWSGTGFGDVFVPVPAAVWLFGSGLLALLGFRGRRRIG